MFEGIRVRKAQNLETGIQRSKKEKVLLTYFAAEQRGADVDLVSQLKAKLGYLKERGIDR